jgi:sortase A
MGNLALAAHRDAHFRRLEDVSPGDLMTLRSPDGLFTYRVQRTFVTTPTDLSVLEHNDAATLTLITCYPFRFVGPAPDRYVVQARLVGASQRLGRDSQGAHGEALATPASEPPSPTGH